MCALLLLKPLQTVRIINFIITVMIAIAPLNGSTVQRRGEARREHKLETSTSLIDCQKDEEKYAALGLTNAQEVIKAKPLARPFNRCFALDVLGLLAVPVDFFPLCSSFFFFTEVLEQVRFPFAR